MWIQIKEHPVAALHSETKGSYDFHVEETYKALSQLGYPQHIQYFKGWFNNTRSIAKYEVMKERGTLCTVGTSNSEATHSSNEAHMPMKLMGIMSPEEHLLKLTKRSDEWIKRDVTQRGRWNLKSTSRKTKMTPGSIEMDAIDNLAEHPYDKLFLPACNRMNTYTATPNISHEGVPLGHHVKCNDESTSSEAIYILAEGRCPRPKCITWDHQCVHELVIDRKFHRLKWGTRWWRDEVYDECFGENGSHLHTICQPPIQFPAHHNHQESCIDQPPVPPHKVENYESTPRRPRQKTKRDGKMSYTDLVQPFATLADDICQRNQPAAHLLHGFIHNAIILLSDVKSCNIEESLLSLMNSTTTDLRNVFDGVAASLDDPLPMPALSPSLDNPVPIPASLASSDDPLPMPASLDSQFMTPDLKNVPVTRPIAQGAPLHNRIKSRSEIRGKRTQPSGFPRDKKGCTFCSLKTHNITSCAQLRKFGTRLKESEVDQVLLDLKNAEKKNFDSFFIPKNTTPMQQYPKDTTQLVIYGRAYFANLDEKPFISDRADKQFAMVTFLTKGSCGVALSNNNQRFLNLAEITAWTTKTKINKKNLIRGTKLKIEDLNGIKICM